MKLTKIAIFERYLSSDKDVPLVHLLSNGLPTIEIVAKYSEADILLLPCNYITAKKIPGYFEAFISCSQLNNLLPVVMIYGDYSSPFEVLDVIGLRTSAYESRLLPNEVVVPPFVDDLGLEYGFIPREKKSQIPVVGFSGMVGLPNWYKELQYQFRKIKNNFAIMKGSATGAMFQGLYFRRCAISCIKKSTLVQPHFNLRNSFSGNTKTIVGDPTVLRKEFVHSIQDSDLALVIRGDGNFSLRFFEVLSLGRVPIFIDTDSPLPLEKEIDYDRIILRVPYQNIDRLPEIIREFWDTLTPEEYIRRQVGARELFVNKLQVDSFYRHFFNKIKPH